MILFSSDRVSEGGYSNIFLLSKTAGDATGFYYFLIESERRFSNLFFINKAVKDTTLINSVKEVT